MPDSTLCIVVLISGGGTTLKNLIRYMDAGRLVPDDIVVAIMAKAIVDAGSDAGLVLDGFPRTVAQAEALEKTLAEAGKPVEAVVVIGAEDEVIIRRIVGRRSCPECGRIYHMEFMLPKSDEICDDCQVRLTQRDDDTEEVVVRRLAAYRKQTAPVISFYAGRAGIRMIDIDGSGEPGQVAASMVSALGSLVRSP